MTLIISTLRKGEVLVTADGRCIRRTGGKVTEIIDDYQKIFPVPDHALAFVHHGENELDGKPVQEFLQPFIRHLNAGNLTIEQVCDELRTYAHPAIRKRLRQPGYSGGGSGFWIVGWGAQAQLPEQMETFWRLDGGSLTAVELAWKPNSIVTGGDGKKHLRSLSAQQVDDEPIEQVRQYHRSLMDDALKADIEPNTVGGHVHELLITPSGWKWTIEPKKR